MNKVLVCTCALVGLALILVPTLGCGGGGGGGGGTTGGQPVLRNVPILWVDVNDSGTCDGGDQLIFRFDRAVANGGGDPAVEVTVAGPGAIAAGSTWADGPDGRELTATLAAGSTLTPGLTGIPVSFLNIGGNTITNPADAAAGNALPAASNQSIMVNFSAIAGGVGAGVGNSRTVFPGTWDPDPQWEILVGKSGQNEFFQSSAYGVWTGPTIPTGDPALDTRSLAAADIDLDGDFDYISGNLDGANYVWLNDGTGNFSHVAAAPPSLNEIGAGATRFVFLAQWDGVLGVDLFVANNGTNYMYFGDGGGLFDGPAPGSLPGVQNRYTFPGAVADTVAAVVGDWNIDGAATADIITVDDTGGGATITQHIITPGAPGTPPIIVSTPFPAGALASPRCASPIFFGGAGDTIPDLLVGYDNGGGMQLWEQAPVGTWTLVATITGGNVYALNSIWDLNGDGVQDVVQGRANNQPDQVFLNSGAGTFFMNSGLDLGNDSTFSIRALNADDDFGVDFVTGAIANNRLWVTAR